MYFLVYKVPPEPLLPECTWSVKTQDGGMRICMLSAEGAETLKLPKGLATTLATSLNKMINDAIKTQGLLPSKKYEV